MNGTLYLIRGLPGSGKTTTANHIASGFNQEGATNAVVYSADMYFEDGDGNYTFDHRNIGHAHSWCQKAVRDELQMHTPVVLVANTFTTEREMKPYLKMAEKFGYTVVSLIVENRHGNKSVHDVPDATIAKMRNRFTTKL